MKNVSFLYTITLLAAFALASCKNDSTAPAQQAAAPEATAAETPAFPSVTAPVTDPTAAAASTSATPPAPTEPPQNDKGVWHYTCPKGCKKGGGSATPCATCGTTLVHNTAYHGKTPSVEPSPSTVGTPTSPTTATPAPTPEPAQNKAGVWHYTCTDGCAGGAGAASPCAKCKKTLVHNTAYHQ